MAYPTSHKVKRDWDAIERAAIEEENKELEKTDVLYFLRELAGKNDNVKRAFEKSFIESGGTSLSSNWDEVKDGTYTGGKK